MLVRSRSDAERGLLPSPPDRRATDRRPRQAVHGVDSPERARAVPAREQACVWSLDGRKRAPVRRGPPPSSLRARDDAAPASSPTSARNEEAKPRARNVQNHESARSGWQDLNLQQPAPKAGPLPG